MTDIPKTPKPILVGRPVLIVIDVQKGCFADWKPSDRLPMIPDSVERMYRIAGLITAARDADIPIIFFKEEHRASMIDFGRELDGTENVHVGTSGFPSSASRSWPDVLAASSGDDSLGRAIIFMQSGGVLGILSLLLGIRRMQAH